MLAHRADGPTGTMLFLHNLGTEEVTVDLSDLYDEAVHETDRPNQVFADQPYRPVDRLEALDLAGYGYRWIRLHHALA